MSFELLKEDAITPQRMYSILCLVRDLEMPDKSEVFARLQPPSLIDNSDAADRAYLAIRRCGLAIEEDNPRRTIRLLLSITALESIDTFRKHLQSVLLGNYDATSDNFLLNQFAAWYAVQDHNALEYSNTEIELRFNEQLYPNAESRAFRERRDYNGWRAWAEFLGWGWTIQTGSRRGQQLAPDATSRLRPLLSYAIDNASVAIPFGVFMSRLALLCPELDGGVLFEQCWQASRGNEVRSNRLSLMLSTALRTLHNLGMIELINRPDATETWTLFPAQSHIGRVSHIRRKAAA